MNLYDLHNDPKSLYGYDKVDMEVTDVFWKKYKNKPKELKKREAAIAKSAHYSYMYAKCVLNGPFPAGEMAIAQNSTFDYWYALDLLHNT